MKAWLFRIVSSIRLRYEQLPIVLACEAGPLGSAVQVASCIFQLLQENKLYRCYMMYGNTGQPGVVKTPAITDEMASTTRQLLQNNKVNFTSDFCTCSTNYTSEGMKQQYATHLLNFIVNEGKPKEDGTMVTKLHGKAAGNDDLAVAIIMNYRWYVVFKTSHDPRYNQAKLFMPPQVVNRHVQLQAPSDDDLLTTSATTTKGTTISDRENLTALQKFMEYKEKEEIKKKMGGSVLSNPFS